jgi:hypothetical protein
MPGIARCLICHVAPPARLPTGRITLIFDISASTKEKPRTSSSTMTIGERREEGATSHRGPDFLEISSLSPISVLFFHRNRAQIALKKFGRQDGTLSNGLLRLPRFLTKPVLTPYCRKCLVPCGEDLRVRQQIVEHVLAWTDYYHPFALSQREAKLNVAPTGRKDRVLDFGKNNDRISCHEIFTIVSGDPETPARLLAEVKPSGRHGGAYRKQLLAVSAKFHTPSVSGC